MHKCLFCAKQLNLYKATTTVRLSIEVSLEQATLKKDARRTKRQLQACTLKRYLLHGLHLRYAFVCVLRLGVDLLPFTYELFLVLRFTPRAFTAYHSSALLAVRQGMGYSTTCFHGVCCAPAINQPTGLLRTDGERPDGLALILWYRFESRLFGMSPCSIC